MSAAAEALERRTIQRIREIGWSGLTPIQEKAVPVILRRRNALLVAPTGSGKTEAAVIPILTLLSQEAAEGGGVRMLYVTPLRALNRDIFRRIIEYAKREGLTAQIRHGDTPIGVRRRMVEHPPDVLITTPETLAILLTIRRMRTHLRRLGWVVVDELHELLGSERGAHLSLSLERLARLSGQGMVRVGLSATIGDLGEASRVLVGRGGRCAVLVDPGVRHYSISLRHVRGSLPELADHILEYAVKPDEAGSVLLFTNTRDEAEHLGAALKTKSAVPVEVHHGSLSKEIREEAEARLRGGEAGVVVSTSSLELGLDIGAVDLVIQMGSPRQAVKLVQRVGRSRHRVGEEARGLVVTNRLDDELEALALIGRVKDGRLESSRVHAGALDVLAHHLVGLALEEPSFRLDDALLLIRRGHLFQDILDEDADACLRLLEGQRILRYDGEVVRRRGAETYRYYFDNISTIPDVEQFEVVDTAAKKLIGRLDQLFVGEHCEPGKTFVLRGSSWRILSVDDDRRTVYVEPLHHDPTAVPYWVGELIPVEHETARRVGRLRRMIVEGEAVPISEAQKDMLLKTAGVLECTPDERTIVVEEKRSSGTLVIHACFGSKVNQTLATLLSALLSSKTGVLVEARSDPYRVLLSSQGGLAGRHATEALFEEYDVEDILSAAVVGTHPLNWRTWHVAKKFGVVSKAAQYDRRAARLIQERYRGTVLYREVLRELLHEKYDVERAKGVLQAVREGRIRVVERVVEDFSPLAEPIIEYASSFTALPPSVEKAVLKLVKERLENTKRRLLCLSCGRWQRLVVTREAGQKVACGICRSPIVTATYPGDDELVRIVERKKRGKKLSREEEERFRKAWKIASLVQNFGRTALFVLSGFGVGHENAGRILRQYVDNEEELLKLVYRAERQYVATRSFWHD